MINFLELDPSHQFPWLPIARPAGDRVSSHEPVEMVHVQTTAPVSAVSPQQLPLGSEQCSIHRRGSVFSV